MLKIYPSSQAQSSKNTAVTEAEIIIALSKFIYPPSVFMRSVVDKHKNACHFIYQPIDRLGSTWNV